MFAQPANEVPSGPAFGPTPPDANPEDMETMLTKLDAVIWSDRGMDEYEQRLLRGFMEMTAMKIQAQQQGAPVGPGPLQQEMQPPPPGADPNAEVDQQTAYGGTPMEHYR